jgi:hypothetical protein
MKPIARTYLSLAAFYAADARRRDSRERDVGLWWRSDRGPTYRAAWVQETGELYLFQHALTGPASGAVHLVAGRFQSAELDRLIDGWRDRVGQDGSFEWLLDRLRPAAREGTPAGSRPAARAPRRPSESAPERSHRPGSNGGRQPRRAGMTA